LGSTILVSPISKGRTRGGKTKSRKKYQAGTVKIDAAVVRPEDERAGEPVLDEALHVEHPRPDRKMHLQKEGAQ